MTQQMIIDTDMKKYVRVPLAQIVGEKLNIILDKKPKNNTPTVIILCQEFSKTIYINSGIKKAVT